MKHKRTITFSYWHEDLDEVRQEDREQLEEQAWERINYCLKEGFTSGELIEEVNELDYSGHWEMTTENVGNGVSPYQGASK